MAKVRTFIAGRDDPDIARALLRVHYAGTTRGYLGVPESWTKTVGFGIRKKLRALHRYRLQAGYLGNLHDWAEAIALVAAVIGDAVSLDAMAKHCRYIGIEIDEGILGPVSRKVSAALCADAIEINSKMLGELLQLTIIERADLRIRTIDSCEENGEQRRRRLKAEHAAKTRAESGARPRAQSMSQLKPWVDLGCSERTYKRHLARGTLARIRGRTDSKNQGSKGVSTNSCQSSTDVHEFVPNDEGDQ